MRAKIDNSFGFKISNNILKSFDYELGECIFFSLLVKGPFTTILNRRLSKAFRFPQRIKMDYAPKGRVIREGFLHDNFKQNRLSKASFWHLL